MSILCPGALNEASLEHRRAGIQGNNRSDNLGDKFLVASLVTTMPKTAYLLPEELGGDR